MTAVFPVLPVANVLFAFETSNFAGKVIVVGLLGWSDRPGAAGGWTSGGLGEGSGR